MAIAAAARRRPSSIRCRPFRLRAEDGRPASRFVGPRGALTKMARSGDELPEAAGVDPSANLHGDPSPRAHAPTPEGVPVGVAHRHVDVRPAADARRDVVDPELQVLVHGGLQGERSDDPRRKMSLRRGHVPLRHVEHVLEARLAQGRAVVADDHVLRNPFRVRERELLIRREANVSVEGRLEPPIDSQELELLGFLFDGGIEEIEVEDRPDDVLLDAGRREILLRDHVLLQEGLRLLPILLEGSRGEEPPLELLDFVRQLDDREALDVPRVLDPLGGRELRLLEEPIVAAFLLALLRPEQVAAPVERDQEFVLDLTEIAVRREGAVRDEDRLQIAELSLDLLGEDVLEFPEHERLVHGAADRPTVLRFLEGQAGTGSEGHHESRADHGPIPVTREFSSRTRAAHLAKMQEDVLDVLVIGGGIVGAGIARDAARRGLRTGLLDRGDFASGTSGKTSRLIHGGLRYLQTYRFRLVRSAARERDRLLDAAPALVHPLPFVIPAYKGRKPGPRLLRFGLILYDLLSTRHLPRRS